MLTVFVEPFFPRNQREFVRGLRDVGAEVVAIGESPREALDGELLDWMIDYLTVGSVCDEDEMTQAVQRVQSHRQVDRLEATVEAHILPIAKVRERCSIPGTSAETAFLCRDKPAMKEALRNAEVPCAQSIGSGSIEEIVSFADEVGYPLVVKPRAGAGAAGTTRVNNLSELVCALEQAHVGRGGEVAIEEFIEGHEGFYDTITIDGKVVLEYISHYYPNVLEAMRKRWISPMFLSTNRVETAGAYDEVKSLGRKVIAGLNIETSATHMEWFVGPNGLKFSEIGCRPPGVGAFDLYNVGNDMDLFREWASAIVHGTTQAQASRRFSTGIIALRPENDGRIHGYEGIETIRERFNDHIIDCHLPEPGTPTQPVEAGYMANAWIRMKHEDYDQLKTMMEEVGRTVKVLAG